MPSIVGVVFIISISVFVNCIGLLLLRFYYCCCMLRCLLCLMERSSSIELFFYAMVTVYNTSQAMCLCL